MSNMRRSMRLYTEPDPDYLLAVTYIKVQSISDVFSTTSKLAVTTRRRNRSTFRTYINYYTYYRTQSEASVSEKFMIEYKIRVGESIGYYDAFILARYRLFVPLPKYYFDNSIHIIL